MVGSKAVLAGLYIFKEKVARASAVTVRSVFSSVLCSTTWVSETTALGVVLDHPSYAAERGLSQGRRTRAQRKHKE